MTETERKPKRLKPIDPESTRWERLAVTAEDCLAKAREVWPDVTYMSCDEHRKTIFSGGVWTKTVQYSLTTAGRKFVASPISAPTLLALFNKITKPEE